jgi:hypothetical protein
MSCLVTVGIPLNCVDSVGGIRTVYLTTGVNVTAITNSVPDDGIITGMTMASTTKFYKFEFMPGNADFEQKNAISTEKGSNYVAQTLKMTFTKMDSAKRAVVKTLAKSALRAVIVDQNGVYWYLGEVNMLFSGDGSGNSGKAKGDLNGFTIQLNGEEPNYAQTLDATYVTTATTGFLAANVA